MKRKKKVKRTIEKRKTHISWRVRSPKCRLVTDGRRRSFRPPPVTHRKRRRPWAYQTVMHECSFSFHLGYINNVYSSNIVQRPSIRPRITSANINIISAQTQWPEWFWHTRYIYIYPLTTPDTPPDPPTPTWTYWVSAQCQTDTLLSLSGFWPQKRQPRTAGWGVKA